MARLSGLILTLLLVVGATGLLSAPAMAMDTMESSALEQGEQIFNSNCAACHMGGGNVIRANRTLKISDLNDHVEAYSCLLYTSPSPRDATLSRMPSSA